MDSAVFQTFFMIGASFGFALLLMVVVPTLFLIKYMFKR